MDKDPIITEISIKFRRLMLFVAIATSLWIGSWLLWLWHAFDMTARQLWYSTMDILFYPTSACFATTFRLIGLSAVLLTAVLYLVVALWWRKRGAIHHRGVRVVDMRDGEQS